LKSTVQILSQHNKYEEKLHASLNKLRTDCPRMKELRNVKKNNSSATEREIPAEIAAGQGSF